VTALENAAEEVRQCLVSKSLSRQKRSPVVWSFYRLIEPTGQRVIDCMSIDVLKRMVRERAPGRYTIVQISRSSRRSGSIARRWGAIVKSEDGKTIDEIEP
jgi:hypothetical protein